MHYGITPIGRANFYTVLVATAIIAALFGYMISRIDPGGWRTGMKTGFIVFGLLFVGIWIIVMQRIEDRNKGDANASPPNRRHRT